MDISKPVTVLMIIFWLTTGASIEILTDRNIAECGRNLTLTCKIEDYTSIASWMYKDDVIPIASCVEKSCNLNPRYAEHFKFAYNLEQGVFNLTIKKLTKNDNGRIFVCSDGYASLSKLIAFGEYQALLFEDTENNLITTTSGCISPDTNVMFKWRRIDAYNTQESEFYPQLIYTNAKRCSNISVCSTNQQIEHLLVISAKPSANGKYYLKITMTYENKTIKSYKTALKYNIEEKVFKECDKSDERHMGLMGTMGFITFSCLLCVYCVIIMLSCKRRDRKIEKKQNDRKQIIKSILQALKTCFAQYFTNTEKRKRRNDECEKQISEDQFVILREANSTTSSQNKEGCQFRTSKIEAVIEREPLHFHISGVKESEDVKDVKLHIKQVLK